MSKKENSRKVYIVLGSPRKKGNSTILAQEAARGIEKEGGEYEFLRIQGSKIKPCKACEACKKKKSKRYCAINDDMEEVYPKLEAADAVLIASPVYWFTVSAQTKLFMDRCYALDRSEGNALAGKLFGVILTFGGDDVFDSGAVNAVRMFQDALGYIGAPIAGFVYGSVMDEGEAAKNRSLMDKAFDLGRQLVKQEI